MILTYKTSKELLQSQGKFYINPGLDRMFSILKLIGNPQNKIKVIHVAGTNGKGSVCSILANILTCSGYKTGLYTSPHLIEYNERIKINGINISQNNFAEYINEITTLADSKNIDLTEFEILTAAAFKYFYDENVDIALIETGLGGRLDATNVCISPLLTVITSVSLDHTDRLGANYQAIAFEKAGIIKKNCPVIVSKNNNGYETIKQISKTRNAILLDEFFQFELQFENLQNYILINNKKFKFSLLGLYQKQNLELVFSAINYLISKEYNITETSMRKGFETVKWSARFDYIKQNNLIIDGAHNPAAAFELKKSLDFYFKNQKRTFIYSTLNTKDYKSIAQILFNDDDEIFFNEFQHKNALTFEEYKSNVKFLKNLNKLNPKETNLILNKKNLKILTGSLYMIGEFYSKLQ